MGGDQHRWRLVMTERQRVIASLRTDFRYQAMLFVRNNAKTLAKYGMGVAYSLGDYMALEKYMIEQNKNSHNITLQEVISVLKDYRN